jgi:flagellar biosynthesis protein FliQ
MMNLHSKKSKTILAIVAIVLVIAMIIPFVVSMFV